MMRGQLGWTAARSLQQAASQASLRIPRTSAQRQLHYKTLQARAQAPRRTPTALKQQTRGNADDAAGAGVARQETIGNARSGFTRVKNLIYGTGLVVVLAFGYGYVTDTRSSAHQYVVVPLLRTIVPDAEDAHHVGNRAMKALYAFGLHPRERGEPDAAGDLKVEVFGTVIDNPVGTSAGLDKNAEIPDAVFALGAGLVEVGGITPKAQAGNERPRVWRIPSQQALINRYGLNSEGADVVAQRLRLRLRQFAYDLGLGLGPEAEQAVLDGAAGVPPGSLLPGRLLAVQVAKMKNTPEDDIGAIANDYVTAVDRLGRYADILVVNVSSPNTPGLRNLQATEPLTRILSAVVDAAKRTDRKTKPAVMVKVSPDEDSDEQVRGIADAVWASGVDGVIVGNTTKKRPDPLPKGFALPADEVDIMLEMGGYSGPQLFERTVSLVKKYRTILDQGPPELPPPPPQEKKADSPAAAAAAAPAQDEDKKSTPSSPEAASTSTKIEQSIARDAAHLKPLTPAADAASKQPLIKLPDHPAASEAAQSALPAALSNASPSQQQAPQQQKDKVIFATGGITNGEQALQVLNAGASVVQVYTAVVYGGAGTVTRIKREMRGEIESKGR